ncbi:hypothetical protein ACF0H5_002839 [Mactra antiquata]
MLSLVFAKMKFRQRIAWLVVVVYLGGTFAFFYYMFEINEHYNQFAVDHVQKYHSSSTKSEHHSQNFVSSLWGHLTDVPLTVWLLIFLLPYLQLFMMILACTRAEPKHSFAYLWPGLLFLKYQQVFKKHKYSIIPSQISSNGTLNGQQNNNCVIHT